MVKWFVVLLMIKVHVCFTFGSFSRHRLSISTLRISYYNSISRLFSSDFDRLVDDVLGGNFSSTSEGSKLDTETMSGELGVWKEIDWAQLSPEELASSTELPAPSPVERTLVKGRIVNLKRDDQFKLPGSQISGNKARKMWTLSQLRDFPKCIVSYGGPQSNAMVALAAITHFQNQDQHFAGARKKFVYYTKKLSKFLKNQPSGNLFRAKSLGMELVELSPSEYKFLFGGDFGGSPTPPAGLQPPVTDDSIWIPQGGACPMAMHGARMLANEIYEYWLEFGNRQPLTVVVPGGTCSSALFLHRALKDDILTSPVEKLDVKVCVVPCVGDNSYARRQMMSLNTQLGESAGDIPDILLPAPDNTYFGQENTMRQGYFQFGEPSQEILDTYRFMKDECGTSLDLLYGAPCWALMLRHWRSSPDSPLFQREIMYVHSGGLEGISSQLLRYKYKGLVELDDVQLPGKNRSK